jgi:hypothetical protein
VCGQKLHLEDEQTLKNWFSYIKVGEGGHFNKGLNFTIIKPLVSPPGESDFKKSFNHSQRAVFSMELQRSGPLMAPESITEQKSLGFSANPTHTRNKKASWEDRR